MDRMFLLSKEYVEDKYDPDGRVWEHLLRQYCRRNMDRYQIIGSSPAEIQTVNIPCEYKAIPIGPLEFVRECVQTVCQCDSYMQPIEIPEKLWNYACRDYRISQGSDIPENVITNGRDWFLKDAGHLKSWNNLLISGSSHQYIQPDGKYVVSERVAFLSEYRVFVYRGEIAAVQNYLGDPLVFPDGSAIRKMQTDYERYCEYPKSYTMDVGIIRAKDGTTHTALIEIHAFVSCGLYGFYDQCLLNMAEDGIGWYFQ